MEANGEDETPTTRVWKRPKYQNEEARPILAITSTHGVERLPCIDNTTMNLRISKVFVLLERSTFQLTLPDTGDNFDSVMLISVRREILALGHKKTMICSAKSRTGNP